MLMNNLGEYTVTAHRPTSTAVPLAPPPHYLNSLSTHQTIAA